MLTNFIPESFISRAKKDLTLNIESPSLPLFMGVSEVQCPFERQYILRMMVRNKGGEFLIPSELDWLKPTILELNDVQVMSGLENPYVYVTVRHGLVTSETDDTWHVDGFSMRIPHCPEQNYICSSNNGTEYLAQRFNIPPDFNPLKHNIHQFYQDMADETKVLKCMPKGIYLIDPYCVHRRPKDTQGKMRTFWRVSFIPIEIEDNTCQQNPLMSVKKYNRKDIRNELERYPVSSIKVA